MGLLKKKKEPEMAKSGEDLSFTTCPQCHKGQLCPGFASTMSLSGSDVTTGKVYICDNCSFQIPR